jgi:molybdenum cofactor cytidylyltransferase
VTRSLLAGLVPAAGASRRLGQDKRLVPFRGASLLEATVDVLRQGGLHPLVVVLEPDSPCRRLAGLADATLVVNPAPERGMLSSIRAGLSALPGEVSGVAVLPGDQPLVPVASVRALCEHFCSSQLRLLVPSYGGQRGHPLLLHRDLFAEACACDDRVGLRQLLDRCAGELAKLELPACAAELDLDKAQDLARLRLLEKP